MVFLALIIRKQSRHVHAHAWDLYLCLQKNNQNLNAHGPQVQQKANVAETEDHIHYDRDYIPMTPGGTESSFHFLKSQMRSS